MKFTKEYSKLENKSFTTIRKNTGVYSYLGTYKIRTPSRSFMATVTSTRTLKKADITEETAQSDADCSREELIGMLEKWYGKKFDDFVLITLDRY